MQDRRKIEDALNRWSKQNRQETFDDRMNMVVGKAGGYLISPLEILTGMGMMLTAYGPNYMVASHAMTGDLSASHTLFAKGTDVVVKSAIVSDAMKFFYGEESKNQTLEMVYEQFGIKKDEKGYLHADSTAGRVLLEEFRKANRRDLESTGGEIPADFFYQNSMGAGGYVGANFEYFRETRNPVYWVSGAVGSLAVTARDVLAFSGPMGKLATVEA
jgi:hypothetical protein